MLSIVYFMFFFSSKWDFVTKTKKKKKKKKKKKNQKGKKGTILGFEPID